MQDSIVVQLRKCADRHDLHDDERYVYDLAGRGMLMAGRYVDAVQIYTILNIGMPTDLLILCADRLLATGRYQEALEPYREAGVHDKLRAYGMGCMEAKEYALALDAFIATQSHELLLQLGDKCAKARQYKHAVAAFKAIGAHVQLLEVGTKCLSASKYFDDALAAFSECGARDKMEELGNLAFAVWLANPADKQAATVARSVFQTIGAKHKLVELGDSAMSVDTEFAFEVFKEAGAKHKLSELGDRHLANGAWDKAVQPYILADEADKLFQCAIQCMITADAHNAFCRVYGYNKVKIPVDKFMQHAATLLEQGKEKAAFDIYSELSVRRFY